MSIVCETCNDTHMMTLYRSGHARDVMCTRCPAPCEECRGTTNTAYCAVTPCPCACHPKKEAVVKTNPSKLALLVKQLQDPEMRVWLAKQCGIYIRFAIRRGEVFDPVRRRSAEATKLMIDVLPKEEFPKLHELFEKWATPGIDRMRNTSDLLDSEAVCTCPPEDACAKHLPLRIQELTQRFHNLTGQKIFVSVDQDGRAHAVRADPEDRQE